MAFTQQLSGSALSGRERALLVGGIFMVLAYALYVGLIEPHYKKYQALERQVPEKIQTYAWMEQQVQSIRPLLNQPQSTNSVSDGLPLVAVLENSLKQMGLSDKAKRILPGENGEVKIWFADVEFSNWLLWLDQLKNRQVHVATARIESAQPGITNIQASFSSSGN